MTRQHMHAKDDKDEANQCVHRAATCGADVVAKCSDFPIFDKDDGIQIASLNVHCGVGFGEMAGVHVGNDYDRREFIVMGESIDQVTTACDAATYGELMASPEAYNILQRSAIHRGLFGTKPRKKINQPIIIASRNQCFFTKRGKQVAYRTKHRNVSPPEKKKEYPVPFDKMDITSLRYLQKLLSFYVHPVVVNDETTRPNNPGGVKVAQERHRSEAELRSVYTVFIKPLIQTDLTDGCILLH